MVIARPSPFYLLPADTPASLVVSTCLPLVTSRRHPILGMVTLLGCEAPCMGPSTETSLFQGGSWVASEEGRNPCGWALDPVTPVSLTPHPWCSAAVLSTTERFLTTLRSRIRWPCWPPHPRGAQSLVPLGYKERCGDCGKVDLSLGILLSFPKLLCGPAKLPWLSEHHASVTMGAKLLRGKR